MTKKYTAANWSRQDDSFTQTFDTQNKRQFWLPEEISLTGDIFTWKALTPAERDTYMKVLAGLTLLDTLQGDVGVPAIAQHVEGHQRKAVLSFMAMVENAIHAKSYSNIFMTLATTEEIDEVFRWAESNKHLQEKARLIDLYYADIKNESELYMALTASVFLESFLFYSGFYYPLYFGAQGKLMNSAEIIALIIRDESIHGAYVGLLAQEIYAKQDESTQSKLKDWTTRLLERLYANELEYTRSLYDSIGLTHEVKNFVEYNANKALANLGFEPHFDHAQVNQTVLNGLSTKTKSHDFFSAKGNSYKIALVEPIQDSDFIFEEGE